MSTSITSNNLEDTKKIADAFMRTIELSDTHATVYGLSGDLGSGKTTFAKEVAEILGISKDEVTSPTFVIEKIYKIKHSHFTHLVHIDAYRLDDEQEIIDIGWNDIVQNNQNLILIEWPEKVRSVMPQFSKTISFKFVDEITREIILP